MRPVIEAMASRGTPYRGVLYAGLMLTTDGPKILEFNCRFGDPETQGLMPRLVSDPLPAMLACAEGSLDPNAVAWSERQYVGVVMASGGYPDHYDTGLIISGLDAADSDGAMVFCAGVASGTDGRPVTSGGRVLTVVGGGDDLREARNRAYTRLAGISFDGAHSRTDIAAVGAGVAA